MVLMRYWVFTIGLQDEAPPPEWFYEWGHHLREMWFPNKKRPVSVSAGDRALIYGSQSRGFLGAVSIVSHHPEQNLDDRGQVRERFPWKLRYQLLVAKIARGNVASPDDAGINPRKIQRGPHTEISRSEYESGVDALTAAARSVALH
jgi:hypothetical protein